MNNNYSNETVSKITFWEKHPTFSAGFCAFCVIAASITFYFTLLRFDKIHSGITKFFDIIEPVLYGLVIAFLLNPIMQRFENLFIKLSKKKPLTPNKTSLFRGLSIVISIIIAFLLIYVISSFIFPEIIQSLENISTTLPNKIDSINLWGTKLIDSNKFMSDNIDNVVSYATKNISQWFETTLSSKLDIYINYIKNSLTGVINVIFNLVIGIACSIYLLYNKEKFMAQCKKILYAFFKPKHANNTILISNESLEIFTHSIIGKIIDSIILGMICFGGLKLFKMPYPVLISVIIGITNIVPMFGPWIGGIPCGLLVLLTNPEQTIYFAIFILCLQQFDANFLTPKIVGNYIGLPAFWVLVACLIGGGFFGVLGLILCVPIFGILYHLFSRYLIKKLRKKELPLSTEDYKDKGEILKEKIKH